MLDVRVSTTDQANTDRDAEGFSIPAQREACYRKAADLGAEVVDEYLDRGESAKTADRAALQVMMQRIRQLGDVDFVIVHKIDRLARNRADDANLTVAIYQHGAQLVSCTEQIDDTPSGKLVHGIMASINEWYSANLATEAIKGMEQKAKKGGTPTRAPVGYLNVGELIEGREIRTVKIDPARGPHVQWAFRAFGRGNLSITELTDELERRGLESVPIGKKPSLALHKSRVANMLRDRYYIGVVTFKGAQYPGRHEQLIIKGLFHRVQEILDSRTVARERRVVHEHYLKGCLFCRRCGSRLIFSRNRGHGGVYDYFFCVGRQRRNGCPQPHSSVEAIEREVIAYYYREIQLPDVIIKGAREHVHSQIEEQRREVERQAARQERQLVKLEQAHRRLLDSYLGGALTLERFKPEQDQLNQRIAAAHRAIQAKQTRWTDLEGAYNHVLYLLRHCGEAYEKAPPEVRRLLNQTLFERLYVETGAITGSEVSEPFAAVLAHDFQIEAKRQGTRGPKAVSPVRGSNKLRLAPSAGLEPAHTAPEADALSAELRGRGLKNTWEKTQQPGSVLERSRR